MTAPDQNVAETMREIAAWYRLAADAVDQADNDQAYNCARVAAFHAEPVEQQLAGQRASK